MSRSTKSKVAPLADYHLVKDAVGNVTLQPPTDEQQRAAAFRRELETWIELAKDAPDPIREWFNVGPIEAQVLLSFSKGNRKEPRSVVAMYGRDSLAAWRQTHQGMAFARSGWLGDGHHRCYGLIESGAVIRVAIDFGVDDAAFDAVDMGRSRTLADQLSLVHGIKCTSKFVAAVRMCMALAEEKLFVPKWSLPEVRAGYERHKSSIEALKGLSRAKYPAAFWGAMVFAHPRATHKIESMTHLILRGEGLVGPAYTLREYVAHADGRRRPFEVAVRTLYAARAFIEERPLARFSPRDEHAIIRWFLSEKAA
ncbi:hypothetical protein LZC95_20475 [Pendulispora brunnea]|uniref:Uncharacterized protein n=1 Tax=Pendulispora brunnea TaxID=2905690 RepID=A0ABZ2KS84_9BACT